MLVQDRMTLGQHQPSQYDRQRLQHGAQRNRHCAKRPTSLSHRTTHTSFVQVETGAKGVAQLSQETNADGQGNGSNPTHREPEDILREEIRCACTNHYYIGGGGCLGCAKVTNGRIFCDFCEYHECACLCPGCRTEHCSGLKRYCTCPCCKSDRGEITSMKVGKRHQVLCVSEATSIWPSQNQNKRDTHG